MPTDAGRNIEAIVASIKSSRKYRDTHADTIRELVKTESKQHKKTKAVEKAVRKRLHSIAAPYLGDPNYDTAGAELTAAFQCGNQTEIRETCARIMTSHLSTRERLSILDRFYSEVFRVTGAPNTILDIACGLNPLAFPWMGLPAAVKYHAYDIHERRVDLVNTFFSLQGLPPLAKLQDVAICFPTETADVALFLKELHRFERNHGGLGLALLEALRVRYLVVSFPAISYPGGRKLADHYRRFFHNFVAGKEWSVTEIEFESELIFCADKGRAG